MSPRDGTVNLAVKNCGEAFTEWNCNAKGSGNFLHKSKQQQSPYHLGRESDWGKMKPKEGTTAKCICGAKTEPEGLHYKPMRNLWSHGDPLDSVTSTMISGIQMGDRHALKTGVFCDVPPCGSCKN
jgi:hypothetical protein